MAGRNRFGTGRGGACCLLGRCLLVAGPADSAALTLPDVDALAPRMLDIAPTPVSVVLPATRPPRLGNATNPDDNHWRISPPHTGRWATQAQATKTTHPASPCRQVFRGPRRATHYPRVTRQEVSQGRSTYMQVKDHSTSARPPQARVLTIEAWMRPDRLRFTHGDGTCRVHCLDKGTPNNHE
jgi:hypothetical protein